MRLMFLAEVCDGDARRALNALEIAVLSSDERPVRLTRQLAEESVQRKAIEYDATGDAHYDAASADQEHSRQRSRCGTVLAGAHAGSGRGCAVLVSAIGDSGERGCGQCRSARTAAGGRGDAGLRVRWACPNVN